MMQEPTEKAVILSAVWSETCFTISLPTPHFPLLLVRDLGICSFLVSVALGIFFLIRYFLYGISVEGWTSLMLVLLAFFGITLLSIGIMGIYLMNILNESKKMPHYVIRRKDV